MIDALGVALFALLAGVGWLLVLAAFWLVGRRLAGDLRVGPWRPLLAGGAGAVVLLGTATPPSPFGASDAPFLRLPLAWPVWPLVGWATVGAFVGLCVSATGWVVEGGRGGRRVAGWAGAAALCGTAWWSTGDFGRILRGEVGLSASGVVGAILLCLVAGAAGARGWGRSRPSRQALSHLTLGAMVTVFSIPVAWMLLTSFRDPSAPGERGSVWVPMVAKRHAWFDPERPLVAFDYRGAPAVGVVASAEGEEFVAVVERPYPLRGARLRVRRSDARPVPRYGAVVTARVEGLEARLYVRERLIGGRVEAVALEPEPVAGRAFTLNPGEFRPALRPGVSVESYAEALDWMPIGTRRGLVYLRNSLWLALMTVVGTLLGSSFVAYGFARHRFPGRRALFALLLSTLMLPGAVTLLPRFLLWRALGGIDTLVPIWLPSFFGVAFYVFLLRQFFLTVPRDLEDAATIDGCSPLRTYWSVMLPQVKPALGVIGVWTFMSSWNDFLGPLVFVSSPDKLPVSYALQLFHDDRGSEVGLTMAFATMATLPVFLAFLVGRRWFGSGLRLGRHYSR